MCCRLLVDEIGIATVQLSSALDCQQLTLGTEESEFCPHEVLRSRGGQHEFLLDTGLLKHWPHFFWVLLAIFITEVLLIFIEIIFENKMNAVFHSNIQEGIRHYYDDLDFKNILDFVQDVFSCCGGDEYKDWNVNQYHSCNGSGPLACGVPYTCCIKKVPGEVINTLCGYKTLEKERLQLVDVIHVRGCIHAVGLWFKDNFEVTFGIVCSLLLPQVLGLVMAWLYWRKLDDIYCRLDTVDFKALEVIDFKAVDFTGAGWCLCFPREGGYIPVNITDDDDDEEVIGQSKV
ncbi:Tetraspanin-15 [Platysternon megacephalum]|uniref:Tetraspanin-15 n=1 Tax=Platysternon megacephalum TaxID=55544 RepID=A0A4D9DYU0_9SAUR|nr:Tetraspanin-15 [Platysternon megacephalum]